MHFASRQEFKTDWTLISKCWLNPSEYTYGLVILQIYRTLLYCLTERPDTLHSLFPYKEACTNMVKSGVYPFSIPVFEPTCAWWALRSRFLSVCPFAFCPSVRPSVPLSVCCLGLDQKSRTRKKFISMKPFGLQLFSMSAHLSLRN